MRYADSMRPGRSTPSAPVPEALCVCAKAHSAHSDRGAVGLERDLPRCQA